MAKPAHDPMDDEDIKGDMTPMIDIIFLLLIFFLLTTKFIVPEKMISSLLPTNKGQAAASPPKVEPPKDLNIRVVPPGYLRSESVEAMDTRWRTNPDRSQAVLMVGKEQLLLEAAKLDSVVEASLSPYLAGIHEFIHEQLERYETPGSPRKEQSPVIVHCFSGTAWRYALVAYDAVRAYELAKTGQSLQILGLEESRPLTFAPPRIRNYHSWELGNELWEILNMQ